MAKFRKKPVEIEAVRWDESLDVFDIVGRWGAATDSLVSTDRGQLCVGTLEGTMRADKGDWIIKGVKGEIYPCKPDIFAATYDPVAYSGDIDGR